MLKRAKISGYKSLVDTEIIFNDPLTLIIGPNASGKSNLFDALNLLSRLVTRRTLQDAFDGHRGSPLEAFTLPEKGIEGLLEHATVAMRFEVDIELTQEVINLVEDMCHLQDPLAKTDHNIQPGNHAKSYIQERSLRYTLHLQMRTADGKLHVVDEELVALTATGTAKDDVEPFVVMVNGNPPLLSLRLENQSNIPPQGIIVSDATIVSVPLYPLHHPHIIAFREELARWRFYNLEPGSMRDGTLEEALVLEANGGNLAEFYNTLKVQQPKKFGQIQRELRMIIPQIQGLRTKIAAYDLDLIAEEDHIPYSAKVISEGTLRVLGILALTNPQAPTTLIGFEEPENGVHPHRMALIANHLKSFAKRRGNTAQILLTSHSPFFPEFFSPDQVVVCQREDGKTTIIPLRQAGVFPLPTDPSNQADEDTVMPSALYERIMRGDYGG